MTGMTRIPQKLHAIDYSLSVGCNVRCKYCPQALLKSAYYKENPAREKFLRFETFKQSLTKLRAGASLGFAGMSEPFFNRDCARMIRYAHEQGFEITLFSTLVGMTQEDLALLEGIPFRSVTLHIPDANGNSQFVLTDAYLKLLRACSRTLPVTAYSCHGAVHPRVADLLATGVPIHSKLHNRAGNLQTDALPSFRNEGLLYCSSGSSKGTAGWVPTMLPDGTLLLCSFDYALKHPLGNLLAQEWPEITSGNAYRKIVAGLYDSDADILCRSCPAAKRRQGPRFRYNHLAGANAIEIGRALSAKAAPTPQLAKLKKKLLEAKTVCIFGIGKLFFDTYFTRSWDVVVQATLLSDNDPAKWGRRYGGLPCVPPETLRQYDGLLVVTYVRDDEAILAQLQQGGIANCINIFELHNALDLPPGREGGVS